MRETQFIEQNKKKWLSFEQLFGLKKKDPDKLSNLFVEITDDLSYSRTFYSRRWIRVYLNSLAQNVFNGIYKGRRPQLKKFVYFWKEDLPQLVYHSHKQFLLAFLIFVLSMIIGVVSSANDPEFVNTILGHSYVSMTEQNINNGDPMAVYKQSSEFDMLLGITFNNLMVAFRTFALGVLFAIGTVFMLVYNGIMVGTFQYFFYERGLFFESFLTIWQHGTLEISAIIIAGAAGMVLGKGLVFPGTLSRLQAFQISARKGIKIMIGIVPVFIFAAFVEGFVTRHTDVPTIIRIMVILSSLIFIIGYFVWYPRMKARIGFAKPLKQEKLPPSRSQKVDFENVQSNAAIFGNTFVFYKKYLKQIFLVVLSISFVSSIASVAFFKEFADNLNLANWKVLSIVKFFEYSEYTHLAVINTIMLSINSIFICYFIVSEEKSNNNNNNNKIDFKQLLNFFGSRIFNALLISAIMNSVFFLPVGWAIFLTIILLPFFLLWIFISQRDNVNIFTALGRTFYLLEKTMGRVFGLYLILGFLSIIYYLLVNSPFLGFYFYVINMIVDFEVFQKLYVYLIPFIMVMGINLTLPILLIGHGIQYYSLREIKDAVNLRQRIKQIALR